MNPIKKQKRDLENERDADFAPPSFYFSTSSSKSNPTHTDAKLPHTPVTNSAQPASDFQLTEGKDVATSSSSVGTGVNHAQTVAGPAQPQPGTFPMGAVPPFPPPHMHNAHFPAQPAFGTFYPPSFPFPPSFPPPPFMYPSHPPPAPPPPPPGVGP